MPTPSPPYKRAVNAIAASEPIGKVANAFDPRRSFGLRIKEMRGLHGLTQEELAERSGLFRTYLSRIESGLANPALTVLYQIAGALGVAVAELLKEPESTELPPVRTFKGAPSRGRVRR